MANRTLLQHKFVSVIETFAKLQKISFEESLDIFYKSYTYRDMRDGISDMHCRSDEYLAEELLLELAEK